MFDVLGRLTDLRERKGWSVYKLAKLSGIPQSTIATWYQRNLYPPIDKLETLCQTLGVSLSVFFYENTTDSEISNDEIIEKWSLLKESEKKSLICVINEFLKQ